MKRSIYIRGGAVLLILGSFGFASALSQTAPKDTSQASKPLCPNCAKENSAAKSDSAAEQTPIISTENAPDTSSFEGNEYVRQSDLFQIKDLVDLQAQRAVVSNYTVNLAGYGITTLKSREDKNPGLSFVYDQFGLNLSGKLRDDNVEDGDIYYTAGLYFAPPSGFRILDLNIRWELLSGKQGFNPDVILSVTGGQFLTPFGSENLAAEDKKPTINSAQFLTKYGFAYKLGRDVGVSTDIGIWNETDAYTGLLISHFSFTGAIINGNGFYNALTGASVSQDTSRAKDVILKLVYTPSADFFSSLYGAKISGTVQFANVDFIGGKPKSTQTLYDLEGEYLKKPFLFTAEYVEGKTPYSAWTAKYGYGKSFVGTIFYTADALPDFQPLIRYDWFDPDYKVANDASKIYSIGFNYYFYQIAPLFKRSYAIAKTERVIKLQVNYNSYVNDSPKLRHRTGEFIAQVVYSF
jgi:hypothetical protein